jgi:hypothetical protein
MWEARTPLSPLCHEKKIPKKLGNYDTPPFFQEKQVRMNNTRGCEPFCGGTEKNLICRYDVIN